MAALPFTVQRRIAWGECDPARIYYTPRVADYAVEAVEAWYAEVLGVTWAELADRYELEILFAKVDCDYHRPLVASQVVQLQVFVTRVGRSSVSFAVIGEDDGDLCFGVRLVVYLVERKKTASVPIPEELRRQFVTYQAQCEEEAAALNNDHRSVLSSGRSAGNSGTNDVGRDCLPTGAAPFSRQRRVVYGDCDATGKVYPPRIFTAVVETIGEWYEEVVGISWMDLVCKREQGAPFVSASCEYLRPMLPDQRITIAVWVTRLGGASIGFAVLGYDASGDCCFSARLVACFIDRNRFKTMRIPEVFRQRIEAYQLDCEALEVDKANAEVCKTVDK